MLRIAAILVIAYLSVTGKLPNAHSGTFQLHGEVIGAVLISILMLPTLNKMLN